MSDYISVPREEWLQYILNKHRPFQTDIGDQRDPYPVTVCSCLGSDSYKKAKAIGYADIGTYYAKHLQEILEKEYYNRLDKGDMR